MTQYLWLIPVGFAIGAYGTLIGAGGGFVLVPLLLLLYPQESPEIITSISLAVVFFNALSGSVAYARMKRIHYPSGLLLSAAAIPGAVLGALSVSAVPRRTFDVVFALIIITTAIYLILFPEARDTDGESPPPLRSLWNDSGKDGAAAKDIHYNPYVAVGLSTMVGYVSSLLGIGGGIIHVPALVHILKFPVHVATATSHFILAVMALTGTLVHVLTGSFHHGVRRTICLAIGVVVGAQFGAYLSNKMPGGWIIRILAVALAFVAVRILLLAFQGGG